MEKEIITLSVAEGVRLCLFPANRFKTSIVSLNIAMPLNSNVEERAVLAFLLRRCSAKYENLTQLNRMLANLYGASLSSSVIKKGEAQIISLSITSVNDKFAIDNENISGECLKLLLELLFEPKLEEGVFSQKDTELEKRLLLEKIDSEFSDKRSYALSRAEEEMCRNELYGISRFGKSERIKELTPTDITCAWREMLEKGIIQINAVGCDENFPCDEIKKRFSEIDRSSLCENKTEFVVSCGEEQYVEEKQAVKQGKLVMGLRAGMTDKDDNNYVIHVMTDMFGGGTYSKLFMNVREKMSLCYYCSARFVRSKGIIIIQSGIEEENEQKAIDAIKKQLEDMKNGSFTKEDLENSIRGISDTYLSVKDTPEGIDNWYSTQYISSCGEKLVTPEEYVENIKTVTAQQVRAAAGNVTFDTIYMLKSNGEGGEEE